MIFYGESATLRPMYDAFTNFLSTFSLTETDAKMIAVGLVFFVVLYKFLQYKVFGPILQHVEQREGATKGSLETAAMFRQKAQALTERYEEQMFKARVEGNTSRLQIINDAKKEAAVIASAAEAEVAKTMKEGRDAIAQQLRTARAKAEQDSAALAELLAHKVDSELSIN